MKAINNSMRKAIIAGVLVLLGLPEIVDGTNVPETPFTIGDGRMKEQRRDDYRHPIHHHNELHRFLAMGDFASVNTVLQSVVLDIDESPVITETVAGSTLTISLDNITCNRLQLGDVTIDWKEQQQQQDGTIRNPILLSNSVKLHQVDLDCSMQYDYNYLFFSGSGALDLVTANNTVVTKTNITTTTTTTGSNQQQQQQQQQQQPATSIKVDMTSCRADILIEDMQFDGDGIGLLGSALNSVEGLVRSTVADKMQAYLCTFLGEFQVPFQTGLEQFLQLLQADDAATTTSYQPLRVESNLRLPRNVSLLNFKNPQATSGKLDPQIVGTLMDQVSKYLSATTTTSTGSSGAADLNLNRLLRESLLDADGGMTVDLATLFPTTDLADASGLVLFDTQNELGDWSLRFTSARISGLDSFTKIDPLEAIGRYTLESSMAMDNISIQLNAVFEIKTADKSLSETFVLDMVLSDISLSIALLMGIDANTLGQLPLGAFMDISNVLPCIMTSVYRLKSTGLNIQNMTLEPPVISGFASPGLQRVMSEGLEVIFGSYNQLLSKALPNIMEATVMDMLDSALTSFLGGNGSNSSCPAADTIDSEAFIDFRDLLLPPEKAKKFGASGASPYGDLAVFIKEFINEQLLSVDSSTGRTGLAEMFIVPMTKNQSGAAGSLIMKDVVDFAGTIGIGKETASIALNVRDVLLENLDSIGAPLFLLNPVREEAYLLNNTVTFGVSPDPLMLQAKVLVDIAKGDQHIYNDVGFSVALDTVSALFQLFMKMPEEAVMTFPLQNILVWDCWLASIPAPDLDAYGVRESDNETTMSLPKLAVSIASMNFTVDCANCSSIQMEEFAAMVSSAKLNADVTRSASNVINLLLAKISCPSSFIQTTLDRLLVDAGKFCPHSPRYKPNETKTSYNSSAAIQQDNSNLSHMVALLGTMIAIAIVILALYLCVRCCVLRRHRRWLTTLPKGQVWSVYEEQEREREDDSLINRNSKSLFRSKEIPALVRWFAPIVLLGNIGLFLSGHLSKGGNVELHVEIGGQKVAFTDFYTFSIAQTGLELWGAGYKPLAMLMLIVAGVWPYTKQLVTIGLWFLPPRWVKTSTRGTLLLIMDFLAKWSMVDVFVMIVSLAAFRVQIQSPDLSFVPDDLYQIDILVVPVWGLYANMLAQILSQITSHFIIGYHRLVVYRARKEVGRGRAEKGIRKSDDAASETEAGRNGADHKALASPTDSTMTDSASESSQDCDNYPLYRHAFNRPHRGDSERLVVKRWVNVSLAVLSLVAVLLTVIGCSVPSVSFDYQGIVGIAVESGQDFTAAKEYISVFSLTRLLMDQARFLDTAKDMIGMLSVSILLLLSTFFVPVALVLVLLVEWFQIHKVRVHRQLRSTVEILQAWQYIEVLVLSLIIGAWQIGDVSELLLDDYCGGRLGGILSELASFGLIKSEDATCFRVQAAIEPAAFVLVAAGVILIFLGLFVSSAVYQRSRDEIRAELEKCRPLCQKHLTTKEELPADKIKPVPVLFTDQFRWFLTAGTDKVK